MAKGVDIEMRPLDEDHVRAKITWSEQDVGGGKLVVEITVRNMKIHPKTDEPRGSLVFAGFKPGFQSSSAEASPRFSSSRIAAARLGIRA